MVFLSEILVYTEFPCENIFPQERLRLPLYTFGIEMMLLLLILFKVAYS